MGDQLMSSGGLINTVTLKKLSPAVEIVGAKKLIIGNNNLPVCGCRLPCVAPESHLQAVKTWLKKQQKGGDLC